jgi:hypothetical protein
VNGRLSLRLDFSLFRRGDIAQVLFDQNSTFLQLQRNLRVLTILNQQSLPQSEREEAAIHTFLQHRRAREGAPARAVVEGGQPARAEQSIRSAVWSWRLLAGIPLVVNRPRFGRYSLGYVVQLDCTSWIETRWQMSQPTRGKW